MSAAQFIEQLFGELPHLFKNEDELRMLWGEPSTRKGLLEGLAEKGFGGEQLAEIKTMINAEKSDLLMFSPISVLPWHRSVGKSGSICIGVDLQELQLQAAGVSGVCFGTVCARRGW